ncbi:SDR family NAD(P)-dependent oxidoreductase [Polynucleobacter sp. AP-Nickl1-40-C4]|uniref:SDR family NAD(P)-dependent oxidoreductase n=1 Tax=Polynucleobacter sp. AP-Nickl1-40-C4 TaxID=3108275 RepID=UPI002B23484A|nr:SDR family NAD(P)-dependent oxidoreductase [Polynucleobacter sp. AP-Nickl1-40-C4]MEA9568027.1 SDR family NAD(P)-dependent oxidoreductase [Polynucleobacter sp. AP-Nickl1-40-C4]
MEGLYLDKTVLVTGSRRGIGKLIVEHFLLHGAKVFGFSLGDASITHPSYTHFQVDVASPESVQKGFGNIKRITDCLDIVINNAGVITAQYSMIMPAAAAQLMANVNLLGPFFVSREASKVMRKKRWGRIVNISSMAASLEPIGDSIYAATKAGVATMANVMAKELSPLNITCNTLAVTAIETDMLEQLSKAKIDEVISSLPIPRYATPDDIFNVLDFLVSERSGYVTAQTIYLGGVN